ncbi:MAG TPA: hypothetical protein DEO64_04780 [Alcaligenes faecalis]|nr:hypothetical protein [Alcaligenes faecalis]
MKAGACEQMRGMIITTILISKHMNASCLLLQHRIHGVTLFGFSTYAFFQRSHSKLSCGQFKL